MNKRGSKCILQFVNMYRIIIMQSVHLYWIMLNLFQDDMAIGPRDSMLSYLPLAHMFEGIAQVKETHHTSCNKSEDI